MVKRAMTTHTPHTLDVTELRLMLRPGLRWDEQEFAGGPCAVIEDPVAEAFFRVGLREARFLRLLDGTRTVREVVAMLAEQESANQLSLEDATRIGDWLLTQRLASTRDRDEGALFTAPRMRDPEAKGTWQSNPVTFRIPLGRPQRFLDWLTPWLAWTLGPIGFTVWIMVVASGGFTLVDRWPEFLSHVPNILDGTRGWRLGLAFVGLKCVHELAHALACRRHGGTVGSVGIYFLLFSPLPYVDVTSTWRMASKWQRIQVSIAGVYAELFVAAIAAWIWGHSLDPLTRQTALEVFFLGSVATLVVNANPLMRFDGYFVLADLVGVPNLYGRGRRAVSEWLGRLLVAPRYQSPSCEFSGWQRWALTCYGLGCLTWSQMVTWGLVVAMAAFWEGVGVLLAVSVVVSWYGPAVIMLWKSVRGLARFRQLAWRRLIVGGGVFAGGLAVLWQLPVPDWQRAPGVVAVPAGREVRIATPGFIAEIRVVDGQRVEKDDVLLRLRNDELTAELADVEDLLEKARIEARRHLRHQAIAAAQADEGLIASLETRRDQLGRQVAELLVRAPRAGLVVAPRLADRHETYLAAGDEILLIHEPGEEEIQVSLDQRQATEYRRRTGSTVVVRFPGFESARQPCELIEVEPRGAKQLPHWSLSAAAGGDIAVSPVENNRSPDETVEHSNGPSPGNGVADWEATEAYFIARLRPTSVLPVGVPIGLRCQVHLADSQRTFGQWAGEQWQLIAQQASFPALAFSARPPDHQR